ncbi:hypothetical protein TYRP_004323 [Tyrophagus putrescentiae]|nr:hypothetical protein TYRP_004323 [Tyrophagus putrescentiae]
MCSLRPGLLAAVLLHGAEHRGQPIGGRQWTGAHWQTHSLSTTHGPASEDGKPPPLMTIQQQYQQQMMMVSIAVRLVWLTFHTLQQSTEQFVR